MLEWYRSSYGTDFDNSEIASPAKAVFTIGGSYSFRGSFLLNRELNFPT